MTTRRKPIPPSWLEQYYPLVLSMDLLFRSTLDRIIVIDFFSCHRIVVTRMVDDTTRGANMGRIRFCALILDFVKK